MNSDGTARRRLAPGLRPQWSPDGELIAYVNHGIVVMNGDGSGRRRLTRNGSCTPYRVGGCDWEPYWSPDGKQIAFTRQKGGRPVDLDVVDAASGAERRVTRIGSYPCGGSCDGPPLWSPDGKQLAFTRGAGIYVVNADGDRSPQTLLDA